MALFKKPAEPEPTPQPEAHRPDGRKAAPTPTRREAEAARRARLNPQLSPKEARKRERAAQYAARDRQMAVQEASPGRVLMRDHVDARINPAEFAMPILLGVMALTLVPALLPYIQWLLYATWAYIAVMILDTVLMWRGFKKLVAQRHPDTPLRGLLMYGFNRQMTFRRWRRPPPRVKRGEAY
ncbi:MAG TPA: DUF3043 domain-containing protein [Propionibacterium sp.]|nr:DUF3043 domain-containing protein [Propionibacterium sp.]